MKCLLISHYDKTFYLFRQGIITALIALGIEVVVACPKGKYIEKIESLGARHIELPMKPFISPIDDLLLLRRAYNAIKQEKPDLVHCMSVKPNVYGAIAAKIAQVPRIVSLVCGAGHAFNQGGLSKSILRTIVAFLYSAGAKASNNICFQNKDDEQLFIKKRIVSSHKTVLIRSSGINMNKYSLANIAQKNIKKIRNEIKTDKNTVIIYMGLGRALWSKGVRQFVEASQILAKKNLPVKFILACPVGPKNKDTVSKVYLEKNQSDHFQWLGERADVPELLAASDVVTLPTYYREGVPRSLLEAMAMKRPIVTTDHVGSRETVDHGVNGFLVPPKNSQALAEAIEKLVLNQNLRKQFGEASYQKCLAEFEESIVVRRVLIELYGLPEGKVNQIIPEQGTVTPKAA